MKEEIERFKKFQEVMNTENTDIKVKDIDIKNYLKYLLKNGSVLEKREVLGNVKTKILLTNKSLKLF